MRWLGGKGDVAKGGHQLATSELFRDLNKRDFRVIDAFVQERRFLAGEVIFDAGDEAQALYVVVSGKVAICLPEHEKTPLAVLSVGDFFGELGLLDDSPRSAQARALEPVVLIVLSRTDFERLMNSHARIASRISLQLARHMGLRLRQMLAASSAGKNAR
jgi:CRP/FNR family transcriptional regulator, cyclic AMP receptor protein